MPLSFKEKQEVQQYGLLTVMAIMAIILLPLPDQGVGIMRIREATQVAEKKRDVAVKKLDEELALIARVPELEKELEQSKPEILKYEARLPKSEEVPELFRDIDRFKQTSDLNILFQTRLPPVDKESYVELPIRLEVEGDFDAIATFVNQLERNQRFVQVKEMEISQNPTDRSRDNTDIEVFRKHQAQMVVSTFMFKDQLPKAEPPAQESRTTRRTAAR